MKELPEDIFRKIVDFACNARVRQLLRERYPGATFDILYYPQFSLSSQVEALKFLIRIRGDVSNLDENVQYALRFKDPNQVNTLIYLYEIMGEDVSPDIEANIEDALKFDDKYKASALEILKENRGSSSDIIDALKFKSEMQVVTLKSLIKISGDVNLRDVLKFEHFFQITVFEELNRVRELNKVLVERLPDSVSKNAKDALKFTSEAQAKDFLFRNLSSGDFNTNMKESLKVEMGSSYWQGVVRGTGPGGGAASSRGR